MTTHNNLGGPAAPLSEDALDQLFRKARTHSFWLAKPVDDGTLRRLYELMKWGPTSANGCPARLLFLRTPEAKQRLVPALAPPNVEKVLTAPVTVIVGFDVRFYDKLPRRRSASEFVRRRDQGAAVGLQIFAAASRTAGSSLVRWRCLRHAPRVCLRGNRPSRHYLFNCLFSAPVAPRSMASMRT